MADQYIGVPITVDENELYDIGLRKMQETFPDWDPNPASLVGATLRICAVYASAGAEVASVVPASIFKALGTLAGEPPLEGSLATAQTTWTMQDDAGYTIPEHTAVGLSKAGATDDPQGFITWEEVVVPGGSTTVDIQVISVLPGKDASNLDTVTRADSLTFVSSIELVAPSSGGTDPELDSDFIDRLSQVLETRTDTPIIGRDFAIIARKIAGVYRAAAIDNYNPADGTTDNEKYVTVCPIDESGNPVNSTVKTELDAYYTYNSLVNYVVPIVDPTYTTIDVTYTARADPLVDKAALRAQVDAAISAYLNPGTWGMPSRTIRPIPFWYNTPVVRLNKIIQVIENVGDVDWAEPVTIAVHGGSLGTADITMSGAFPLPRVGTLAGTIVST